MSQGPPFPGSAGARDVPARGRLSSRDPSDLPDVDGLLRLMRSLAVLDAVLCPEWEFRYFSINDAWSDDETLALMRNGEGDDFLVCFNDHGALIKGFAHQAPMAQGRPWPGLFDGVPEAFAAFLDDEASARDDSTFCLWRLRGDDAWSRGPVDEPRGADPDGSARLLRFLDGDPTTYKAWADEYYGRPVDEAAVRAVYEHRTLNSALARSLDPKTAFVELADEVQQIGYPVSRSPFDR
ncbi:MAG: hypothetical protein AAGC60_09375 [Acidobacteriota bacterium]